MQLQLTHAKPLASSQENIQVLLIQLLYIQSLPTSFDVTMHDGKEF